MEFPFYSFIYLLLGVLRFQYRYRYVGQTQNNNPRAGSRVLRCFIDAIIQSIIVVVVGFDDDEYTVADPTSQQQKQYLHLLHYHHHYLFIHNHEWKFRTTGNSISYDSTTISISSEVLSILTTNKTTESTTATSVIILLP